MRTCKKITALLITFIAGTLMFVTLATAATVEVKLKEGIGSYLADEKGMTLYMFKKDAPGKSMCGAANGCADKWPAFYVAKIKQPKAVNGDFGTITRDDGKKQTTYKGLPLYYFFKDKAAGDTNGQGLLNLWSVVAP